MLFLTASQNLDGLNYLLAEISENTFGGKLLDVVNDGVNSDNDGYHDNFSPGPLDNRKDQSYDKHGHESIQEWLEEFMKERGSFSLNLVLAKFPAAFFDFGVG